MDDHHSIREVLAPSLSTIACLLVAITALALLVQLFITVATILRDFVRLQITILKIFVIWPAWILTRVLRVTLKLLKIVLVVLIWAACSVARGVMATFTIFGLLYRRDKRAEPSFNDSGDESLIGADRQEESRQEGKRQEGNVTSVLDMAMAERGGNGWQVHILLPDGSVRSAHDIGILVGGMDGNARAWQATTPRRYGWEAQGSLAQRQITAPPLRPNYFVRGSVEEANRSRVQWGSRGHLEEVFGEHSDVI